MPAKIVRGRGTNPGFLPRGPSVAGQIDIWVILELKLLSRVNFFMHVSTFEPAKTTHQSVVGLS